MARGADKIDVMFVDQQRALGRPWSAIARMLTVSEDLLRRTCDMKYTSPDLGEAARRCPRLASGRENRPVSWAEPTPIERRDVPPCSNAKTLPKSSKEDLPTMLASSPMPRGADVACMPSADAVAHALVAAARSLGEHPLNVVSTYRLSRRMRFAAFVALRARFPGCPILAVGRMTGIGMNCTSNVAQAQLSSWWGGAGEAAVEAALDALDLFALEQAEG